MTDSEMGGDKAAAALLRAGAAKAIGKGTPWSVTDVEATRAMLRPGIINWDDSMDSGVSFNIKAGSGKIGTTGQDLDKLLAARHAQTDKQGRAVEEFATKTEAQTEKAAEVAVETAEDKAVAKVAAKVAAKVEAKAVAEAKTAVKAAAKVEAKATALAAKAKATKEKALEGLGYYGYYLGDHEEGHVDTPAPESKMKKLLCCLVCVSVGAAIGWFAHQKFA